MATIDLLQHEIDRFGVVTVMDVTLYDVIGKNPVLHLDTLKMSNISAEGQQKDITGGKYADLLLTYNFGRSLSLEFQDALISADSMRELWGSVKSDKVIAHANYTVTLATATDLLPAAYTGLGKMTEVLSVINTDTNEILAADAYTVTLALGYVTDIALDAAASGNFRVDYKYEAVASAEPTGYKNPTELVLRSSSFPKTVKLVGKTFVMEQRTGQLVEFEIEIPKLKLASNFTLTMDAEGDASVFDFSGMALIDGANKELIKIKTLGYTA